LTAGVIGVARTFSRDPDAFTVTFMFRHLSCNNPSSRLDERTHQASR
jgi:hypothetical protein